MSILADTHILIWAATRPQSLPEAAKEKLTGRGRTIHFSFASVWEVGIKATLGRPDFNVLPKAFRDWCLSKGFSELPFSVDHVEALLELPMIHRDPFDRIMIAQARIEGLDFLTGDEKLTEYGEPVKHV